MGMRTGFREGLTSSPASEAPADNGKGALRGNSVMKPRPGNVRHVERNEQSVCEVSIVLRNKNLFLTSKLLQSFCFQNL